MSTRSWNTKAWREQRSRVIGNRCTKCGSTEGPFVSQHKWHPPKWSRLLQETAHDLGLPAGSYAVRHEAQLRYKGLKDRYTSLHDTDTYCQKCAFLEDKTDYVLCHVCRKHYHKPQYDQCYECSHQRATGVDLFTNVS